jgi:hypothetical protein
MAMIASGGAQFGQAVAGWHDFYLLVGTAAVTLLGLLFVAVSLNLEVIAGEGHAELRGRAVLTFNSFLYILIFSLIFLIPDQTPAELGWPLLLVGGVGVYTLSLNLLRIWRARDQAHPPGRGFLFWRVILPICWSVVLLAVSATAVAGQTAWLAWLVPVFIARLIAAVRNAWDLLLHVGHDKREDREQRAAKGDRRVG